MSSGDEPQAGTVTICIGDLAAGGPADAAAQLLWERYFERLVREARKVLRLRRVAEDEEDAALSAFDSFCAGARQGRYPRLNDRDDLWRLLVVITKRKALDQIERQRRAKRGGGRVVDASALAGPGGEAGGLDQLVGAGPSPEFAALVAEEYRLRLEALGDEGLRQIAVMRMEGHTDDEIAGRLGVTRRTIQRRLELIREEWRQARAGDVAAGDPVARDEPGGA